MAVAHARPRARSYFPTRSRCCPNLAIWALFTWACRTSSNESSGVNFAGKVIGGRARCAAMRWSSAAGNRLPFSAPCARTRRGNAAIWPCITNGIIKRSSTTRPPNFLGARIINFCAWPMLLLGKIISQRRYLKIIDNLYACVWFLIVTVVWRVIRDTTVRFRPSLPIDFIALCKIGDYHRRRCLSDVFECRVIRNQSLRTFSMISLRL